VELAQLHVLVVVEHAPVLEPAVKPLQAVSLQVVPLQVALRRLDRAPSFSISFVLQRQFWQSVSSVSTSPSRQLSEHSPPHHALVSASSGH
jgi:hypothetical protein